ncbi:MAG: hypothetical protein AAB505_01970 [Patescibacteria group bacterium]
MEETQIINPKSSRPGRFWYLILFVLIIAGLWWWLDGSSYTNSSSETYQAVFLDNNQVYFGKLANRNNEDYATLTDIFYLQVSQPLQPSQPSTTVNLVKLGVEMHGPADMMRINQEHILFIEDLKPDSQVIQAIAKYKEQQTAGN